MDGKRIFGMQVEGLFFLFSLLLTDFFYLCLTLF